MRCATRVSPGAGTIRHVHRGPRRVNHWFQCSTSLFADDSQLLASATPSGVVDVRHKLERYVSAVHDWCTRRRLQLNPSKTEVIWFGSSTTLDSLSDTDVTICLDQAVIHPSDCVRDLVLLPPPPTSQITPRS